jgi:DNA-directed RNA polymerase specialized sigma subunit
MGNRYIDNDEFERIILLYKDDPKTHEEDLVSVFELLIKNIVESFKFEVDPNDAKQECFALVLKTVKNFKPKKGTAFNYFTTVILNQLKLMYTREKKYKQKIENSDLTLPFFNRTRCGTFVLP